MLDVQRFRGAKYREEIDFTRKLMWGHLILGAVVISMFLFHEIFSWFAGAIGWYAFSLGVMYGFMNERKICRWLLALVFLGAAGAGLFFINQVFPELRPVRGPLIPQGFIPVWVGAANLIYSIAALFLLFDARVRRAGHVGFTLW
ncbi:hypothetical protein [Prosthecobacter sp.]|uniref:hypothetical protein n=1 Tax=Prosthecobacter sp. TaxID=1965333 RepID=UPI001D926C9C|nr:hypothetical protein [Prosthecobacter sp.]MCB1276948.1 hypothetical protein [Prosthecobacter sp.]